MANFGGLGCASFGGIIGGANFGCLGGANFGGIGGANFGCLGGANFDDGLNSACGGLGGASFGNFGLSSGLDVRRGGGILFGIGGGSTGSSDFGGEVGSGVG